MSGKGKKQKARQQRAAGKLWDEEYQYVCAPWNFSWVVDGEICGCAWPDSEANIHFLRNEGVGVIVSLSAERRPHSSALKYMECHMIPVEEFEDPSMEQISQFIEICAKAREEKKAVCVHCRMGRGRTGVMIACYLVKFHIQSPDGAILSLRFRRPGSVETWPQERAVKNYRDYMDKGHL